VRRVAAIGAITCALVFPPSVSARPKFERKLRETVTKCPKDTKPVRTADSREPWACALTDEKYREGIECPRGSRVITTSNTYDPFKCALKDIRLLAPRGMCPPGERAIPTSDPEKDYDCEKMGKGFRGGPRCPRGTRPVPTPEALQPFSCIADSFKPQPVEPTLDPAFQKKGTALTPENRLTGEPSHKTVRSKRCGKGTRPVDSGDPFDPIRCVPSQRARPVRLHYTVYRIGGEMSFRYPKGWSLNDAWRKTPPSVLMMPDESSDGRPVTLGISREREGTPDYADLKTRVWQEKDWHGAVEKGTARVAGREAVLLEVPSSAAMALVPMKDGYYVLSYSAPSELFVHFEPAYRTLLSSFKPLKTGENK